LRPADLALTVTGALALGFVGGLAVPCNKPHAAPPAVEKILPRPARQPLLAYPIGCDARMVVSVGPHVYQDRCYVRGTRRWPL
jgi:hypothetical protein